ncbi:MAG TPA: HlyD family efflux transporter periplasmic adaptor subunit [Isosphaeraceae bacterium]|nr:HlyD family efflux transporter periplasmic adaptor subunit [Isosphaeraceae bacterium]
MMRDVRRTAMSLALVVASGAVAWAQGPGTSTARVETQPIELIAADRYIIPVVLEPSRRVMLVAPADGIVRSLEVPVGAAVRELAVVAELDRTEAAARVKIAQAVVKEMQAALEDVKANKASSKAQVAQAEARLEAAKGHAELEQVAVERCTVRAPFAGRVMAIRVSQGQYLPKGGEIAELADVASLKALVPVDRSDVSVNAEINLTIEGKASTGQVQAVLPLAEPFAPLRELAAPMASAWVKVANANGSLEPGQRVYSPFLPNGPIALVPARAAHEDPDSPTNSSVQVVRSEYVTNVPVRVLGPVAGERVQISGPLRPNDVLVVTSSVPLMAGTLIRFNTGNAAGGRGGIETQAPRPGEVGDVAGITPPPRGQGVAPIGAPGSAVQRGTRPAARPAAPRPAPAQPAAGGSVPF